MKEQPVQFVISCQETEEVQELLPINAVLSIAAPSMYWSLIDGIISLDINYMRRGDRRVISPFEDKNHPKHRFVRELFYQHQSPYV